MTHNAQRKQSDVVWRNIASDASHAFHLRPATTLAKPAQAVQFLNATHIVATQWKSTRRN